MRNYLPISGALVLLAAVAGCDQRAETYSNTAAPHAEQEGVELSLLGLNATGHALYTEIRVDNDTDREVVLPSDAVRAQWINVVWSDHAVQGVPHRKVDNTDADRPDRVPMDQPIVLAPHSSRVFNVRFDVGGLPPASKLVLTAEFNEAHSHAVVSLPLTRAST